MKLEPKLPLSIEQAYPQDYIKRANGEIRLKRAKVRGKAAVKAAKRARHQGRGKA